MRSPLEEDGKQVLAICSTRCYSEGMGTSHHFTADQLADAANEVAAQLIAEGVAPDVAARAAAVAAVNRAAEQVAR